MSTDEQGGQWDADSDPVAIRPFRIDVPDADLDDLRARLRRTRWPDPETVEDWSQGVPLSYIQELCRYWCDDYEWRETEKRLNGFDHFKARIDGLDHHFIHARSPHPNALPLVMTHGWPGSVVEFVNVLGPLTDPTAHGGDAADAFHVVCPSLPGYGFSEKPTTPGWTVERIARAWAVLMAELSYERYGAQGGDWGALVTAAVGRTDPEHVVGIHSNMPFGRPEPEAELSAEEEEAVSALAAWQLSEAGYSGIQSTRPQTLGYGLADSPAGQLAWIVEKFKVWTDCDGHPENALSRQQMLDNVMLYWLPGTGASSARLYWESRRTFDASPVGVPAGCSIFPKEVIKPLRPWVEKRFTDLRYWNELDKGGHFAALEQPELFVSEVRSFFGLVR